MAERKVVDAEKLDRDLIAVADAIREKAGTSEALSFPDGMANAIMGISGDREGAFWEIYQQNGAREDYIYGFAGAGWTDDTFYPKYDIAPTANCSNMFSNCQMTDLVGRCRKQGIALDFSRAVNGNGLFTNSAVTALGTIDLSSLTGNLMQTFQNCSGLKTIEKLILAPNLTYYYTFHACRALENLTIEGTISKSGWTFEYCPLNKASLTSVVNCLDTTTSALTITLSKQAVNAAFETATGAADGSTSAEWLALIETRSNWTITLV